MQRLKLGLGLFVFLGLVCAHAAAQDIPEQARKEIAHNLQGPFVVIRDVVQEDLKLTAEQKEKVEEHLRERNTSGNGFRRSSSSSNRSMA